MSYKIKKNILLIITIFTSCVTLKTQAAYIAMTEEAQKVLSFSSAIIDVISDYKMCHEPDNFDEITHASTYNTANSSLKKQTGVDLFKKKLENLTHNFKLIQVGSEQVIKIFTALDRKNITKIDSLFEVINSFESMQTDQYYNIDNIFMKLKKTVADYDNVPLSENISAHASSNNDIINIEELNDLVYFTHIIHSTLDCDDNKVKHFFEYIAAYVDIFEFFKNIHKYIESTINLHAADYPDIDDISFYMGLTEKIKQIEQQYVTMKPIIKPVCSDALFEEVFLKQKIEAVNSLSNYHQKLLTSIHKPDD